MRFLCKLSLASILLLTVASCLAQRSADSRPSIREAKGATVKVQLLDAFSGQVIANSAVEVSSDNGIRCETPPCPTDDKQWRGKSDAAGFTLIPTSVLQFETTIKTPAHHGNLVEDSEKAAGDFWLAELLPARLDGASELGLRPIKLIDAHSSRPLANLPVLIEFGKTSNFKTQTNALGTLFIPFEKALPAFEDTWAVLAGYRRTHLDFAWARRKVKLERK